MTARPVSSLPLPDWFPSDRNLPDFGLGAYSNYQAGVLEAIARIFPQNCKRLLDFGCGNGKLAFAMKKLFPVERIICADTVRRIRVEEELQFVYLTGEGKLPFSDGEFDAAILCNVIHHIPESIRYMVFAELGRVVKGPLLIKDHRAVTKFDCLSLRFADYIGNRFIGGMVEAEYLTPSAWNELFISAGFEWECFDGLGIQCGLRGIVFPDRNEIAIRALKAEG
jgi:SAM-dependent methyltransferase